MSSSTRQWNLLTLTHEYMHSHFRELIRANLFDMTNLEELRRLCESYNESLRSYRQHMRNQKQLEHSKRVRYPWSDKKFRECTQFFFINQLQWLRDADREAAQAIHADEPGRYLVDLAAEDLRDLYTEYMAEYVEEFVVHMMDYLYTFDADDHKYVTSLWLSWSLVPMVYRRLDHYILRSLLALAVEPGNTDSNQAFDSAVTRLKLEFKAICEAGPNDLVQSALSRLRDLNGGASLFIRFDFVFPIVQFTRRFLIDGSIHGKLLSDKLVAAEGAPRYRFSIGEFPPEPILSPTGFLLDRFAAEVPDDQTERASLWQMLCLI